MSIQDLQGDRGGPQHIPRPKGWRSGDPAPWADLADPTITTEPLVAALEGREPVGVRGRQHTGGEHPAGVLVALYDDDGPHVVLTRRSPRLASHTHEVSFPGGRHDPDDPDLWATARREAHEETALDPTAPRLVGHLDLLTTVGSGTIIHPFVALLPGRPDLVANPDEVEAVLHVPLAELLLDGVYREEEWDFPDGPWRISFFELVGDTVWGATAAILRQLLCLTLGVDDGLGYVAADG
ncbi:MAG: CoA pyrophosphatase [Actinobacteria bacterium]|nr:CoA pyrophosphatase [Actinomycetota bacterium]